MTAFVVETGAGLANSNSYVSLAEADDYFSTHPFYSETWEDQGIPEKQNLLMMASMQIDSFMTWRGYLAVSGQALAWPRTYVYTADNVLIASNAIPWKLKVAVMEYAVYMARKGDPFAPTASSAQGIDRLKIDVIELQFTSSLRTAPVPAAAVLALRGLGEYTLGSRVRKVQVG